MKVYYNIESFPSFRNAVVTIGTFDGVHTGHQQIIRQLREEAAKVHGETVIITFDPHPRTILPNSKREIHLINSIEEKIELLSRQHIDHLVIVPFTEVFSQLTAQEYITNFLVGRFHPKAIIIGYDHRFGKGRLGDYHLLEEFSKSCQYTLIEIPVHVLNAASVSSTRIREAVAKSDIKTANLLLGYEFFFEGRVVQGKQLGRTLGFPTANLEVENPEKLVPGNGVYAVRISIESQVDTDHPAEFPYPPGLNGMMNIGFRPTVGGITRSIEVHIFDFAEDLYGKMLRVFVGKFIRPEEKFNGIEALKTQLDLDKTAATLFLKDQAH